MSARDMRVPARCARMSLRSSGLRGRQSVGGRAKPGHDDFYLIENEPGLTKLRNEPNPINMTKRTQPNETAVIRPRSALAICGCQRDVPRMSLRSSGLRGC